MNQKYYTMYLAGITEGLSSISKQLLDLPKESFTQEIKKIVEMDKEIILFINNDIQKTQKVLKKLFPTIKDFKLDHIAGVVFGPFNNQDRQKGMDLTSEVEQLHSGDLKGLKNAWDQVNNKKAKYLIILTPLSINTKPENTLITLLHELGHIAYDRKNIFLKFIGNIKNKIMKTNPAYADEQAAWKWAEKNVKSKDLKVLVQKTAKISIEQ